MGGKVVDINTETFDKKESAIKEAKKVLKSQGAKYRNLSLTSDSDAGKYASNIMAFPTTVLVDRNGNIIGEQFMGGVDDQKNYDALMKQIKADDHLKPKLFPQFAKHKKQAYRICSTRYTCHDAVTPPDHLILFNILLYFFSFFIHHM